MQIRKPTKSQSSLTMKRKWPNLRPILWRILFQFKSMIGSVLCKVPGLCDNWQWQSLWRNLVLWNSRPFLGMAMTVPVADSVTKICFLFETVTEPAFSEALGLRWSVFLEKLEVFPINLKTLLMAVRKSVLQSVFRPLP